MKKNGRILALVMATAMALSLAACAAHPELKSTEDFIKASQDNAAKVKSYDLEGKIVLNYKEDTEITNTAIDFTGSISSEPMQMAMDLNSVTNGKKDPAIQTYLTTDEDGKSNLFLSENGKWTAMPLGADLLPADLAGASSLDVVKLNEDFTKANIENFAIAGNDVCNGLNATIIEGKISGESIKAIFDASGVLSSLGDSDEIKTIIDEMFENDIELKVWVLDSTLFPIKYSFDFTDMLNDVMKKAAVAEVAANKGSETAQKVASDRVDVYQYTIDISFKNLNNATAINVPDAALKALEAFEALAAEAAAKAESAVTSEAAASTESAETTEAAADAESAETTEAAADAESTEATDEAAADETSDTSSEAEDSSAA